MLHDNIRILHCSLLSSIKLTFLQAKKYRGRIKPVNRPLPACPVPMSHTADYTSPIPSGFGLRQGGAMNIPREFY